MKAACIVTACLTAAALVPAGAQKGSGAMEVRLAVSIADRTATADYRIEGDGLGTYVDGQQGVAARLDGYGNLIVNFQAARKGNLRRVSFDYSCADSTCTSLEADPPSGLHDRSYISTLCPDGVACPNIQDMLVMTTQCVQLNWQFVDGQGRTWRNGFHRTRDLPNQEGTAFAVVARIDSDTWTVEPSAAPCQGDNSPGVARTFHVESVRSKWVYTDYGMFGLPFRLTLSRAVN